MRCGPKVTVPGLVAAAEAAVALAENEAENEAPAVEDWAEDGLIPLQASRTLPGPCKDSVTRVARRAT